MASGAPRGSVAVECFDVIDPHNPRDTMLTTGLARFSQIEKNTRGTVDAVARRIGRAGQAEQPLILHRSIREWLTQPCIEPATRQVEEPTHDSRVKLAAMGFDECVLHSDTLRSGPIAHRSSHALTTTTRCP